MTSPSILPLADVRAALETVGGKGASLARLAAAGLPVPDGFHVTTEVYRQFVATNELQPQILAALAAVDPARPATLETAANTIRERFLAAPVPEALATAVVQAYANLGGSETAVAVRSSATAEDLPDLSFAGQQETFLNVYGNTALLEAVKQCWASLWTARAIGYRLRNDIGPETLSLAVVVQRLVPAEAAGVLFTANPLNGRRDQLVINAAWGLGESIVGGAVTPDSITVEKASGRVLERETADKASMTMRAETGTEERPVPAQMRRAPVLDDRAAAQLARLGVQIETLYERPMDIEWALANGTFTILQARPITALPEPYPTEVDWPLPEPQGQYARGSIVDLLPTPLSPLFTTLGLRIYNQGIRNLVDDLIGARDAFPQNMLVSINGYAYMNMNLSARQWALLLLRMLPAMPAIIRTAETRWRDDARPRYLAAVDRWQARPAETLSAAQLLDGVRALLRETVYYLNTLQSGTMGAAGGSEGLFTLVYEKLVRQAGDPPASAFLLGFDSVPIQAEKSLYDLAQWCRGRPTLAAYLSSNPTPRLVAHWQAGERPANVDADDWRAWRIHFEDHLKRYGHSIYDLDFAQPLPADDPTPLLEALKMYLAGRGTNPYVRQQTLAEQRQQATQTILDRLGGLRHWLFAKSLQLAQWIAPLREDGIADIGLGYPLLRRLLHELGRRLVQAGALDEAGDVFWLGEAELADLVAALDNDEALINWTEAVRQRKVLWRAEGRLIPPPQLPSDVRWLGIDMDLFLAASAERQVGGRLRGVGASPGQVTATARVLHGPEDFGKMQPGDVLVASITTPAWTPLFAMASAIVTDVGGPLSHGSIVAREYGIPAVLGTGVASKRIHDGQTISVDGSTGVVLLSPDGDDEKSPDQARVEWSVPDTQRIYVRVGISELLPDPLSPLFASLATEAVSRSANEILGQIMGMEFLEEGGYIFTTVNGYGYYSLPITGEALWQVTSKTLLGTPKLLRAFGQGERTWRQQARPRYARTVAGWAKKHLLEQTASELVAGIEEILIQAIDYYNAVRTVLPTVRSSETQFTLAYERLVKRAGDPPAQIFLLGFDNAPLRAEKALWDLAGWCRGRAALASALVETNPERAADLLGREQPPASVDEQIWQEWRARFRNYLNRFGHIVYDLDFAKPVPADDPSLPFQTLVRFLHGQGISPYERQRQAVERREQATETILARLDPVRSALLRRLLAKAQHYAPLREDTLADAGLGWPVLRRMAREVGRRLQRAGALDRDDGVFWLAIDELKEMAVKLDTNADELENLADCVRQRREQWWAQRQATPPQVLPAQIHLLGFTVDTQREQADRTDSTAIVVKGNGTSPGRATGRACVVAGPEDFDKLKPGEVLVARITTPAWTPLFALASAIVTDVGGPLSHGSIVAREYGIPAVLGTGSATQQIRSGQIITVDGDRGIVAIDQGF